MINGNQTIGVKKNNLESVNFANINGSCEIRNLKDLIGKEIQVTGFFVRYGRISSNDETINNITCLLKTPFTIYGGKYRRISSHCWVMYNESLRKCRLRHGDKVTFKATVTRYQKRSGVWDYTLSDIHSASVIQKNPTPVKMGIFVFSSPLLKSQQGFISVKGNSTTLYQRGVTINNCRYEASNDSPPYFTFKLKDIDQNGIFRFYYKCPKEEGWHKYAYFFPNKGQKMFFVSADDVSRIFLDERSYYSLKDAYSQFAFSGEFHFPIKSSCINQLAEKDSNPSLLDGHWPSKRRMVRIY